MQLSENLVFRTPDERDLSAIAAYRQAFIMANEPFCGSGKLGKFANAKDWLDDNKTMSDPKCLPTGLVLATQFILKDESYDKILGMLQLRHSLNDFLLNYGGHIGYSVAPSERRKGYAKLMLKEALSYCLTIGLHKVLITCSITNEASRKTILACGGVYEDSRLNAQENKLMQRYWFMI